MRFLGRLRPKALLDPHSESAFRRAGREWADAVESWKFVAAALVIDAVAAMYAYSLTNDPEVEAAVKVASVGGAVLVGPFALAGVVLLALWVTAPVGQRDEARAAIGARVSDPLDATFSYRGRFVRVDLANQGPTLDDATIHVLMPQGQKWFARVDDSGWPLKTGRLEDDAEELAEGVPSVRWVETGLRVRGLQETPLAFLVHLIEEPTPFKFKIVADGLGKWKKWATVLEPDQQALFERDVRAAITGGSAIFRAFPKKADPWEDEMDVASAHFDLQEAREWEDTTHDLLRTHAAKGELYAERFRDEAGLPDEMQGDPDAFAPLGPFETRKMLQRRLARLRELADELRAEAER